MALCYSTRLEQVLLSFACFLVDIQPVFCLPPIVQTTTGPVQGYHHSGVRLYLGIPYAKPPVGNLRFRRPEQIEPWSKTLQASHATPSCYQELSYWFILHGKWASNVVRDVSEDCLYLDIWVPEARTRQQLSTMVWIHGGNNGEGSKNFQAYKGRFLASEHGVIVAAMNYRLGALGFLYAGSARAPGNMGLLDQTEALKWLYNNINRFGGDNRKITIFGEGKGSAFVSLHLLSPVSRTYFSNAILQSGSALGPFSCQSKVNASLYTKHLAESVGCTSDNSDKMMDCLNTTPVTILIKEQHRFDENGIKIGAYPISDGTFLNDNPRYLLKRSKTKNAKIIVGIRLHEMKTNFIRCINCKLFLLIQESGSSR